MSHKFMKTMGIAVLLATIPVLAQNNEGIAAFNQGNYQEALRHFEEAERAGNQTDALQYNIAVSLYRLGRHAEARDRFERLVGKPEWQVLVRYNLGLVAEALDNNVDAMEYYRLSLQQQENEKVSALALQKINAIEERAATQGVYAPRPATRRWAGLVSLSAGEDSNASSLADDLLESTRSSEDSFHELLLYGHVQLGGRQGDGFRVYGLGFDRVFDTFDHLDSRVVGLGGVYERPLGDYQFTGSIRVTKTALDSRDVADQVQLSAGVSRPFDFGTLNAGYAFSDFDAGSGFSQIEGDQHLLELGWRRDIGDINLRGRYRYETNAREDLQRGGAFASYSPDRHGLRLEARWQATRALSTGLIAEHVRSRYDDVNRLRDTDGQIREARRSNRQNKLTADVSYRFNRQWRAKAEYQYADQRDNFDIYEYDKHRLLGTVEFQF